MDFTTGLLTINKGPLFGQSLATIADARSRNTYGGIWWDCSSDVPLDVLFLDDDNTTMLLMSRSLRVRYCGHLNSGDRKQTKQISKKKSNSTLNYARYQYSGLLWIVAQHSELCNEHVHSLRNLFVDLYCTVVCSFLHEAQTNIRSLISHQS
jgi:hypothetical protein